MKTITFLLLMTALCSCHFEQTKKPNSKKTVSVVIIIDKSPSFVEHCPPLTANDIHDFCQQASPYATAHISAGRIIANSDVPFLRYTEPQKQNDQNASNPWLNATHASTDTSAKWEAFFRQFNLLFTSSGKGSDVGGAIAHGLLIVNEYQKATKQYLLIASDFKNTGAKFPVVPSSVEVITVGVLESVPVEKLLHTSNVKRMESYQSAFNYIISSLQNK